MEPTFWRDRKVLVTGHTGFKGSWLACWLDMMGSSVAGYALDPPTQPSLYETLGLASHVDDVRADVHDGRRLATELQRVAPEVVFHMAAQPLVRRSYLEPVETYSTNVMGTVHLLEAVRTCPSVRVVIIVTTDKVYENEESTRAYQEHDRLGGRDPYSSSKACVELVTSAWRQSFFTTGDQPAVSIVTARSGNVHGGGDWSEDRIVPDAIRAFSTGKPLQVRNPASVRPWQHVLEPLSGYLRLAQSAYDEPSLVDTVNFGPCSEDAVRVGELVEVLCELWGEGASAEFAEVTDGPHEAGLLELDCSAAQRILGWAPRTNLRDGLDLTVQWYQAYLEDPSTKRMESVTRDQVRAFQSLI